MSKRKIIAAWECGSEDRAIWELGEGLVTSITECERSEMLVHMDDTWITRWVATIEINLSNGQLIVLDRSSCVIKYAVIPDPEDKP